MKSRTICLFLFVVICNVVNLSGDVISTPFNSNNGQAGNMFDLNVLNANGIMVEAFELNLDPGTWDLQLYTINSSYVGNETTPGNWTLVDSIAGLLSAGTNNPTFWDFNDVSLNSGTNAFYVTVTNGTAMNYTNGTSEGSVLVADANVQILQGTGNAFPFGQQYRPRNWNGSIQYSANIPEPVNLGLILMMASTFALIQRRRR